ncbi:MAG: Uma2 family endonuclease [Anaerolineae bacterium]|jgi:Uma2 family endonuclease|nr:Uma2 family endonuclease [Anaerolineae bacterium]
MKSNLPQEYIDIVQQKRKITVEEYLQLPETNQHVELIDGELIVYDFYEGIPPLKDNHHRILSHMMYFLFQHIPVNQLRFIPCDVFLNPNTVVQPDVFWVNPKNQQLMLVDGYWHGTPDFVIEILEKGLHNLDYITKFNLYNQYDVQEYWIVNPEEQFIEVYIRKNNELTRQGGYEAGKTFISHTLNISVDVSALLG